MSKIVIVNDDPCLRGAYKKLLTTRGFDVALSDRVGTYERGAPGQGRPNIFLLDMRKSNGPALFEMIRAYYPKAKILLASAFPLMEQKRIAVESGGLSETSIGAD